ncbi:hypothetical protein [Halosegnis marinus]|uniref:Uncharacterized protein n=1 Tax=Halosegnis marinus TaxID=3034023 RepID=A0ABD5ZLV4_9EURY|nr:hypothetical protein [Halosegnis sp. DT85]
MTTRRTLLRAAGLAGLAGLAGCTAIGGTSTPDDDPAVSGPADGGNGTGDGIEPSELDVPRDATRRASIVASDDADALPVTPRVSLADPFATGGSPPVLRVDVDNPGDDPVTVGEYRAVVFQYVGSDDGTYVLLPHSERSTSGDPDRVTPDFAAGDCWTLDSPVAVTMEYGTVEIPAGGTLTAYVGLYGNPETDCLPAGEYRFEAAYNVAPLSSADDEQPPTWGFTLGIEEL